MYWLFQLERKSNTFRDRKLDLIKNNLPGVGTWLNHYSFELKKKKQPINEKVSSIYVQSKKRCFKAISNYLTRRNQKFHSERRAYVF
jgi:hypothetical protein